MGYIKNILVAIDQLGNTIASGNPDTTISGRTGYYANHAITLTKWYWVMLQYIINFTFYPVDGYGHCHAAYHKEKGETYQPAKGIIVMFILSFITIGSCFIIAPILYILLMLKLVEPKENAELKEE